MSRTLLIAFAGLSGCWTAPRAEVPSPTPPADRGACAHPDELPEIVLDVPVHSSRADEAANLRARCRGERPDTRSYHFTPPRTATYRFRVQVSDSASLSILPARGVRTSRNSYTIRQGAPVDVLVTLRGREAYSVVVWRADVPEPPRLPVPPPTSPPFDLDAARAAAAKPPPPPPRVPAEALALVVELDESADARIRPEDPAVVEHLIAGAPRLSRRTLGTFESLPGGLRATCGGLGGATVYALDLAAPRAVTLHVAAQFPVALEVRARSGASVGCSAGGGDPFEASLAAQLPAGAYVVIVDSTALAPAVLDDPHGRTLPGAGVRGGFVLDAEVPP